MQGGRVDNNGGKIPYERLYEPWGRSAVDFPRRFDWGRLLKESTTYH
jgi:hypothetical protein